MGQSKAIIFSAPSGSGKTTIVRHLLKIFNADLAFSVSATNRSPRGEENNGIDYYFLTNEEFKDNIKKGEFLEWEEVYPGRYYGTLRSEVQRIWSLGKAVIFDIDVEGGLNLKKQFGKNALAVFVMPPSIKALEERLNSRQTDTVESINQRIAKAEQELKTAEKFDCIIINEDLEKAFNDAEKIANEFLRD
jgi:guanylate kinase